ncbi:MAG: hypothetical protein IPH36_07125 [Saprospiraceae bacterium]|nr:hypothetical protein [Saprospiraceae bacterium]
MTSSATLNPTAFVAPGNNQSWYFNPGFGVSYIRNTNATTHRSYVINTGVAAYGRMAPSIPGGCSTTHSRALLPRTHGG